MNNNQSSILDSSVRSYKNVEALAKNQNNNFIKYLHINTNYEKAPFEQEPQYPRSTPVIKRHHSQNAFAPKIQGPYPQKINAFHNRFYQSINISSTPKKQTADFANIQNELNKLSANEIAYATEKQLLLKDIKRQKEQILYLREKCQILQKNNQKLLGCKCRAEILQREYKNVVREYERLAKDAKIYRNNYYPQHIPLSLEQINSKVQINSMTDSRDDRELGKLQSKLLKGKEVASRIISSPANQRTSFWKRVGGSPSPMNKLQEYKSGIKKYPYDELPLIQSKIENSEENISRNQPSSQFQKDHSVADKLKIFDMSKVKQYQKKCQQLQNQMIEVRKKNIDLYKRFEQLQREKFQLIETVSQLKYENARLETQNKQKQVNRKSESDLQKEELKKQVETIRVERQSCKIQIIQLKQQISSVEGKLKLSLIQKQEVERSLQEMEKKLKQEAKAKEIQKNYLVKIRGMQDRYQQISNQFQKLKEGWNAMNQKNQEIEIQKRLLENEINQKKQIIAKLQKQLDEYPKFNVKQSNSKDRVVVLEEQALQFQKQLELDQQKIRKLVFQLSSKKEENNKIIKDRWVYQQECKRLRSQNIYLNQNYGKLTKLLDLQKQKTGALSKLKESWREIQKKTKDKKRVDGAVDHLWQIKEIQYDNINTILQVMLAKPSK